MDGVDGVVAKLRPSVREVKVDRHADGANLIYKESCKKKGGTMKHLFPK